MSTSTNGLRMRSSPCCPLVLRRLVVRAAFALDQILFLAYGAASSDSVCKKAHTPTFPVLHPS
jgi:hypothetical protein